MTDENPDLQELTAEHLTQFKELAEQAERSRAFLEKDRIRREANLNAKQLTEEELRLCDSSFKKNNGLIRKLKTITLKDKDALCAEISRVNQTKYVSELVTAIAESSIKSKDIPAAVEICSLLHQRYSDFASGIKEALAKAYVSKNSGEEIKVLMTRRRSCLRLLTELYFAGLFDGLHLLNRIVKDLTGMEHDKDPELYLHSLILLTSFAKSARTQILRMPLQPSINLLQFPDPRQDSNEEIQKAWKSVQEAEARLQTELSKQFHISETEATEFKTILHRAAERCFETVLTEHKKLRDLENENTKVLNAKGELPESLATDYDLKRTAFDNLHRTAMGFAESLDRMMPELPQEKIARIPDNIVQVVETSAVEKSNPLYDDSETREFYEVLPDLRSVVPPVLLGVTEDKEETASTSKQQGNEQASCSSKSPPVEKETEESEAIKDVKQKNASAHKQMDSLIQRLKNCYTRDMADEIAMDFCCINSKSTRKRLVRALCDVPKGCLSLIPFYARIAASLNSIFPDVANGIATQLELDFNTLLAKKDPGTHSLEARICNTRYMGEMCKFKLINYGTVFTCLKQLLDDFTHLNIDAACALIETAGSYLVRLPETQGRMENRLEQMHRLKNAKNLDSRHRAAIDNAYFQCKPSKSGVRRKRRHPFHEYIRHLIFTVLKEDTIRDVVKKLRGVSWDEHEQLLVRCILKANVKLYSQVPLVASLCSLLAKYNDSFAVSIVDAVFEEIQLGMEFPTFGLYQHRVADVRFLGELYNYCLIDSKTVFDTLYWILSFGRSTAEEMNKLDPPSDAFRIKMVCILLQTCGRYFNKGTAKKKLDRFLVYFQRYILSKPPHLSMDIEFEITDTFDQLRPEMQRIESLEEANAAVEALEAEAAAIEDGGRSGTDIEEDEDEDPDETLETEMSAESMESEEDEDDMDAGRKPFAPETDLEFEQELQALLQEHQRLTPAQIKPVEDISQSNEMATEKMAFKVLMKKGGREDKSRKLEVPMSVTMAVRQKEHDNQEAVDRSLIKELVLAAHVKDEEDELMNSGIHPHGSRGSKGYRDGAGGFSYGGRRYNRRR